MEPDEPEPEPARPDCELDQDGRIWVGPGVAARLRDCGLQEGSILSIPIVEQAAPRPSRKHRHRKEHRMEPQVTAPTSPVTETSDAATDATKDAVVAQVVDDGAKAHEVQEAPAASPIAGSDVTAVAGENPLLAFGLALLAVFAAGGAGWKLWTKKSEASAELAKLQAEQAHELAMKQLDLQAQAAVPATQPPPCQVKQAEVDAKLSALSSELSELRVRLEKSEKKAAAFGDNFDADEVKDNLTKLERTVRDMKAKMPKPSTPKK